MNKAQEAFEKWKAAQPDNVLWPDETFTAGYQAGRADLLREIRANETVLDRQTGARYFRLPEGEES